MKVNGEGDVLDKFWENMSTWQPLEKGTYKKNF